MASKASKILDTALFRRSLSRWARAARKARAAPLVTLRSDNEKARQLKIHLDQFLRIADERLALPAIGSQRFAKPHNTDWSWRPELWRGRLDVLGVTSVETKSTLGNEITLFHDCARSEITLRQLRNTRREDLAPYGLQLDVLRFDGSFFSVALDLPREGAQGLLKTHVLRMDVIVEQERPQKIFARLNVKHGPNTEQMVQEVPLDRKDVFVEFDMAYSNLNEKRVETAWIDLIFQEPEMNQLVLRDVTFSRHPRAQL